MSILTPKQNWYRDNAGTFIKRTNLNGISYTAHCGHAQIAVQTNASFNGTFQLTANPTNPNVDASSIAIFVDGVLNQVVQFNVTTLLDKEQTVTINTGAIGNHVIMIQEGERDLGVFVLQLNIDGFVIPAGSIRRAYTTFGDSVSMGVFSIPRCQGWAQRMKNGGSRFDAVTNQGFSGYSYSTAVNNPGLDVWAQRLLPAVSNFIGSQENVIALCMGLNDWVTSADSTSAATFQATLSSLADKLKVAADAQGVPGFKLMLHSLTHVFTTAQTPNNFGSTPQNFNTASQVVASTRPWCTYLDVFNACGDADMFDNFDHPNVVGHGKIYQFVKNNT